MNPVSLSVAALLFGIAAAYALRGAMRLRGVSGDGAVRTAYRRWLLRSWVAFGFAQGTSLGIVAFQTEDVGWAIRASLLDFAVALAVWLAVLWILSKLAGLGK